MTLEVVKLVQQAYVTDLPYVELIQRSCCFIIDKIGYYSLRWRNIQKRKLGDRGTSFL